MTNQDHSLTHGISYPSTSLSLWNILPPSSKTITGLSVTSVYKLPFFPRGRNGGSYVTDPLLFTEVYVRAHTLLVSYSLNLLRVHREAHYVWVSLQHLRCLVCGPKWLCVWTFMVWVTCPFFLQSRALLNADLVIIPLPWCVCQIVSQETPQHGEVSPHSECHSDYAWLFVDGAFPWRSFLFQAGDSSYGKVVRLGLFFK